MSGIETFPVTVVVLDVISGAYSVARQTLRLLSSILFFYSKLWSQGMVVVLLRQSQHMARSGTHSAR